MAILEPYAYTEGDPWPVYDNDWIEYLDYWDQYAANLTLIQPLPACQDCNANEVQPGQDVCSKCLGVSLQDTIDELIRNSHSPLQGNATFTSLQTYYSRQLLERLVPALGHADHGLTSLP